MTRTKWWILIWLGLLVPGLVWADGHGCMKMKMKTGILLAAFGSSLPKAQTAFSELERQTREMFPDTTVCWAYTSSIIRKKMARSGKKLDSVAMALSRMMEEGFTHVAVQSLHTIRGAEYDDLAETVDAFRRMPNGFVRITLGEPLLSSEQDLQQVTAAIIANLPPERKTGDAVVLMGHGTHHPANAFYTALQYHLQQRDANLYLGTVEGAPTITDIQTVLMREKIQTAYLVPFMSVAGDHAANDMAGDEPDSWKNILGQAGIVCKPVLKGTAEYKNMRDIWMRHLQEALARLPHCERMH